jgi:tRNA A-37 threonylcarbamoyl transferase component Bud32
MKIQAAHSVMTRRSKTRVAHLDRSLPTELIETLWDNPESLVEAGEVLNSRAVRQTVRLEWGGQSYVLKQYVEPTFGHALKHSLQPSRAWRTWMATHRLADAGIATPRAVACVENPWGQLRRDSFMMYPYVEGRTLTSYFEHRLKEPSAEQVWRQLGELWQRFAQIGASLADTNVRNFIVCPAGQLWVIDLDTTRFHWSSFTAAHYHRRSWARLVRTAEKVERRLAA